MADLNRPGLAEPRFAESPPSLAVDEGFRLGEWLVEPARNRMTGASGEQHVHPKAMEVLVCLAARGGGVVSRDEILEAAWDGTFVSDQVLANAVWELRRAFGDDARDPHVIETVPKRGYRLLLPVSEVAGPGPSARGGLDSRFAAADLVVDAAADVALSTSAGRERAAEISGREASTSPAPPGRRFSKRLLWLAMLGFALVVALGAFFAGGWLRSPSTAADAAAERSLVVAILPFANHTGDPALDWLSSAVPDVLAHEMTASRHLYVLDSSRFAMASEKHGVEGLDIEQRGIDVARRHGAQVVVSGRLSGSAERLVLFSRFADLDGIPRRFEVEAKDPQSLFEQLAGQLRLALEIEAADEDASAISATGTSSLDAYRRYIEGVREARDFHYPQALAALQAAVELDSGFALAHAELAHLYDVLGQSELASTSVERAIDLSKGRPQAERIGFLRLRARIQDQIAEELDYLRQLVTLRPRDGHWLATLAWFQFTHLRECDEAIVRYRQAIALDPRAHLYAYLGEAAMACDRPKEALEALERGVELEPESPNGWRFLGYLQMLTGDHGAAERSIARALGLAPESTQAVLTQALFLADRQRYVAALEALRRHRGLQISAIEEREGWVAEAEIQRLIGDLEAARRAADRALELDAEAPDALWAAGLVDLAFNDLAAAERRLSALGNRFADSQSRYDIYFLEHLRGKILSFEAAWSDATHAFAEALRARPLEQARYRFDLAAAWLRAGDAEEATGVLYQLLEINPNHAQAHCLAAEAHALADRPQAALLEQRACEELLAVQSPP